MVDQFDIFDDHSDSHQPDSHQQEKNEVTAINRRSPAVYKLDMVAPFVDQLVQGCIDRYGPKGKLVDGERADEFDPIALSDLTILLPNKRLVQTLQDGFLRAFDGQVTLLPRMTAIGELDEGDISSSLYSVFAGHIDPQAMTTDIDLPDAINPLERRSLLMRQILAWGQNDIGRSAPISPAQAWRLAGHLAHLLDEMQTAGLDMAGLTHLVPENLAKHWEVTLEFLQIVMTHWPDILKTLGVTDPAQRQYDRLHQLTAVLKGYGHPHQGQNPAASPIIAVASTGYTPAVWALLGQIARLDNSCVILPGLIGEMDDDTWRDMGPSHHHYALKSLCIAMGVSRHEIEDFTSIEERFSDPADMIQRYRRLDFLSDALRPASSTVGWPHLAYRKEDDQALFHQFAKITAPSRRAEAASIAVIMRETLEIPGKTAALVTPDRLLARQVRAQLLRWGIDVDDSGGDKLRLSLAGRFFILLMDAIKENLAPVQLLAFMQHPYFMVSVDEGQEGEDSDDRAVSLQAVRDLDAHIFRGPRPEGGADGLLARIAAVSEGGGKYATPLQSNTIAVVQQMLAHMAPLVTAYQSESVSLKDILTCHIEVAEQLSGSDMIWSGDDGRALSDSLTQFIEEAALDGQHINGRDYAALFEEMIDDVTVRPAWRKHPRLSIWGLIEARLQRADRMILGGMNEGSWPKESQPDPWMNRQMRQTLGLSDTDWQIGQSAHDFIAAAMADEVILTRAEKIDGSPTVPSRWLFRLEALAARPIPQLEHYNQWADMLALADSIAPCPQPMPKPPVAARPRKLSVTQVESWMRDPYSLYAAKILGLRRWRDIDESPTAATKGTILHDALEIFIKKGGLLEKANAYERLIAAGREAFASVITQPTVYAFWWPRFQKIAKWFLHEQDKRRDVFGPPHAEIWGELYIPSLDFTILAKADRIDEYKPDSGKEGLVIIDYKTGTPPSEKRIKAGYAPQLPLEGLIARAGGFKAGHADADVGADTDYGHKAMIKAQPVEALEFWKLSGGEPAGEVKKPIKLAMDEIDEAQKGLGDLVEAFDHEQTAYLSNPRPVETGYGDFDHLARIGEWPTDGSTGEYEPKDGIGDKSE